MNTEDIVGLSIIGVLWFSGVCGYIYAWIKTRTWPFELSDDELFSRAFKDEADNETL